jgi:hypothetical protein
MHATAQPITSEQTSALVASRPPRLSPELSEFLHMLDALENHFESEASEDR